MQPRSNPTEKDLFVSYASLDRDRVVPIVRQLESAGISVWRDQERILGGGKCGPEIVEAIEWDRRGHLLLLDEGTSGTICCLCPSRFAPETRLRRGRTYLPQAGPPLDAFAVTGRPGREQLLAIITEEPLELGWIPDDPRTPARILDQTDIDHFLGRLRNLEGDGWAALSTYFDVTI